MTQFVRPDADQGSNSWVPGTNQWSRIDEGSDGGDVITSDAVANNVNTTNADFRGSDVDDPFGSVDHILRARWASSLTRDMTPHLELWQGIPGVGTLIASLVPAELVNTTERTDTYTLSAGEANNITDYDAIFFRLWGRGTGGGPARSLVVEFCELQLPDGGTPSTRRIFVT